MLYSKCCLTLPSTCFRTSCQFANPTLLHHLDPLAGPPAATSAPARATRQRGKTAPTLRRPHPRGGAAGQRLRSRRPWRRRACIPCPTVTRRPWRRRLAPRCVAASLTRLAPIRLLHYCCRRVLQMPALACLLRRYPALGVDWSPDAPRSAPLPPANPGHPEPGGRDGGGQGGHHCADRRHAGAARAGRAGGAGGPQGRGGCVSVCVRPLVLVADQGPGKAHCQCKALQILVLCSRRPAQRVMSVSQCYTARVK